MKLFITLVSFVALLQPMVQANDDVTFSTETITTDVVGHWENVDFLCDNDEYLVSVKGRAAERIDQLSFTCSDDSSKSFGGTGGIEVDWNVDSSKGVTKVTVNSVTADSVGGIGKLAIQSGAQGSETVHGALVDEKALPYEYYGLDANCKSNGVTVTMGKSTL